MGNVCRFDDLTMSRVMGLFAERRLVLTFGGGRV